MRRAQYSINSQRMDLHADKIPNCADRISRVYYKK